MIKGNRKETIAKQHKENIVNAAEALFSTKGYQNTTIDEIAKNAEYSKRTLYIYFESKEILYNEITLRGMIALKETIKEGIKDKKDFKKAYKNLCKVLQEFYEINPLYFKSVLKFQNKSVDFEQMEGTVLEIFNEGEDVNQLIEEFIRGGQEQGVVKRDLNLKMTVLIFWSSLSGIIELADTKEAYIKATMRSSKKTFLEYSFDLLLKSILKEE